MNHEVNHFAMGHGMLVLAYFTSVTGSLLGLLCMSRARSMREPRQKMMWTALGALAIGGVGIWLMHFIAMLGFTIPGAPIRYNAPVTALSALIAVVVVGMGLFAVTWGPFRLWRLLLGGPITGFGVASMHYMGMAAVRFQGKLTYNDTLVMLSVLIAAVAATAAIWFTIVVRGWPATIAAGFVMGVAVTGMHYTGMAAVRVQVDTTLPTPAGTEVFGLVFPVFVIGGLVIASLMWALATSFVEQEWLRVPRNI
ncbi:MHYT domain-containing signal sensor [Longimycelium tulufanense]|uniref:MHYT domain-containing signal sensor n=1 Tax=Longimycelium tulufanense TaxID=907463 RepID=A0A8J3FTU5_9PSEU|nr:MHYT domain-containing protein [Longimycelium tulufanense]GGM49516.1 MHYT domain-containing signal sensor [Longimycelium tulufanense]